MDDITGIRGCIIRPMPTSDSGVCRPPVPTDADYLSDGMPSTEKGMIAMDGRHLRSVGAGQGNGSCAAAPSTTIGTTCASPTATKTTDFVVMLRPQENSSKARCIGSRDAVLPPREKSPGLFPVGLPVRRLNRM